MKRLLLFVIIFTSISFGQLKLIDSQSSYIGLVSQVFSGKIYYYAHIQNDKRTVEFYDISTKQKIFTCTLDEETSFISGTLLPVDHIQYLCLQASTQNYIINMSNGSYVKKGMIYAYGVTSGNKVIIQINESNIYNLYEMGTYTPSSVNTGDYNIDNYSLYQNYPNPFNSSTVIEYDILSPGNFTLNIYDIKGKLVKSFTASYSQTGKYNYTWNGKDNYNTPVASGIYLYQLEDGKNISAKKMILLK